ncbi:MAG TPA: hypothetical protein VLC53_10195, partial [Myxococcota bacterium]|nr:hypothetical protein [Myxococcota bacterium]
MATYNFSALSNGAAIAFDPEQDDLVFDQAGISAADLAIRSEGDDVRILVASGAQAGKSILLQDVPLFQLATSNVSFTNGSALLFGDNSTAQNDDAANVLGGTGGNDLIEGFGGADRINAGSGNDRVFGGAGNDFASGNAGVDWVSGGAGNDTIAGGGGRDSFAFSEHGAANADVVSDFASNWDSLHFDAGSFTALGPAGQFSAGDGRFYAAAGVSSGHDADDRLVYNTSTGELFYDADGSGSGAAQLIATLQNAPNIVASDIHVFGSGGSDPGGDVIRGTEGDDSLVGTAGDDSMEGLGGNDTLDGLAGDDTMNGGPGDDTYYTDGLAGEFNPGDVLVDPGGIDTLIAQSATLPDGIENLILRPTFFESGGTGNALDNLIRNETEFGAFIDGAGGNDTLIGGGGFDIFILSAGNDSVDGAGEGALSGGSIDFRAGTATPAGGGGTTVFVNVAAGEGSGSDDTLIADDSGRTLLG